MRTYEVTDLCGTVIYAGTSFDAAMAALATDELNTLNFHDASDASDAAATSVIMPASPVLDAAMDADEDEDYMFYAHEPDDGAEDTDDTMSFAMEADAVETVTAVEPAPSPVALVLQVSEEGATADMAASRHAQLAADLEAALGLAMGPNPYSAGVVMGETGVKRFHASYDAWAARPLFPDACATVSARIVAENRKDIFVCARDVTMNDDGTMTRGGGKLRMEEAGFKMLLAQVLRATKLRWSKYFGGDDIHLVFPRAYQLMAVMPPDLRAVVWNRMVQDAKPGHKLMWRTRQPAGQALPSVYAVVSETYGVFDGDRVLATIGGALSDSGARGTIVYDARRTDLRANASWHADRVFDASTGDVMGLSVSFRSNDARSGSITAHASAECGFGRFTYGTDLLSMRHVGRRMDTRARQSLHEAVGRARVAFDGFLSDWGHLSGGIDKVRLYGAVHSHGLQLLEAMVDARAFAGISVDDDQLKRILAGAWAQDSGLTLTHVARALGRASKDGAFDAADMDIMERAAGAFVSAAAKAAKA